MSSWSYRRRTGGLVPDAVVQIGDYGDPGVPFFPYQDLSFGALERRYDTIAPYLWIPPGIVRRRRTLQDTLYRHAAGVFTMSRWLADDLVEHGQVPRGGVYPVGGGLNVPLFPLVERMAGRRSRLLFIGRDFFRKGGDLVVEAFRLLRSRLAHVTLTVAGPKTWPLPGDIPDGVEFAGDVPLTSLASLYLSHDVFVMPSRFEPFGLVFLEALAYGVPCVGRMDYAMPEIIHPGDNGALVTSDDVDELATAIESLLDDDCVFERCRLSAAEVRSSNSWAAVAGRMLDAIGPHVNV